MKEALAILALVILWATVLLYPKPHPVIESKTCPVDTLVVIQNTDHRDSSWKKKAYILDAGTSIEPYPLFNNGKHRDTIYESKIVYDK